MSMTVEVAELVLSAAAEHPNKMQFKGILVNLDSPSTRAPSGGNRGHRILIPAEVAAAKLDTLIGMGLNYSPSLDAHAQRRKVGVIQKAWIEGNDVWVSGCLWKSDFPEMLEDLKGRSDLGMSMELSNVVCNDQDAAVWRIDDFCFTGATILKKNAAAYQNTLAIAASAVKRTKKQRIEEILKMAVTTKQKTAATTIDPTTLAGILAGALTKAMEPITAGFAKQTAQLEELNTNLAASADGGDDDSDDENITVAELLAAATKTAKKITKKDVEASEDDDEDVEASGDDDEEDDEDVDAAVSTGDMTELADADDDVTDEGGKPGHAAKALNQNHGNKTTVTKGKVKTKKMAVTGSIGKLVKLLIAQNAELKTQNATLAASNKKLKPLAASVEKLQAAAVKVEAANTRRSMPLPPMVAGLLSRAGLNAKTLQDEGRVLSVAEVDGILAAAGAGLGNVERVALKTDLARHGLMDEGRVDRSQRM